jgi:hypothetical protein
MINDNPTNDANNTEIKPKMNDAYEQNPDQGILETAIKLAQNAPLDVYDTSDNQIDSL